MDFENLVNSITIFITRNIKVFFDIALIVILTFVILRLLNSLRNKIESRIIEKRLDAGQHARMKTLLRAGLNVLQMVTVGIAILMILIALGIDITPVLASVGILGLSVSLGAQTLIKDYFGGIIILFENLYNVGDTIEVDIVIGTVERIELRATYVRDIYGKLYTIPNGDVRILSNNSRDFSNAIVDLNIAFDSDISQVIYVLQTALEEAAKDQSLAKNLLDQPKVQGWNNMTEWAVQVRITAKTMPGKQAETAVILRKQALSALEQASIPLAKPPSAARI